MRRIAILILVSLFVVQSSPVSTQPFGPRPPVILNGCTESALFAVLNSDAGKYCLANLLPKHSNAPSDYSVFCSAGKWGCCIKSAGFGSCKVDGIIPTQRRPKPPVAIDP